MPDLKYYAGRVVAFYKGNYKNDRLRGISRVTIALAMTLFGPLVSRAGPAVCRCSCCGWKGSRFLPFLATGYITFDTLCPACGSMPRHRAHRVFYESHLQFSQRSGSLLYFAPESSLSYFLENPGLDVKTSNYPDGPGDYHVDILKMPFPDNTWDYIICHRVIEHLPDDRAGLEAFFRVLKPGGFAVISVPIDGEREFTIDYGAPNALENEHYYDYGMDFAARIPGGFEVATYRFSDTFSELERREFGLIEDFIFICTKPTTARAAS